MDVWEKYSLREEHVQRGNRRESNPSFSSTLLDAIYRSIDESNGKEDDDQELMLYREIMRKKKHNNNGGTTTLKEQEQEEEGLSRRQRACMIERWVENKVSCEKVVVRRKSMADFDRQPRNDHYFDSMLLNSSSSSSESSCGGGFSSSESDSFYGAKSRSNSSSCYSMQRPKPIRTSISSTRPERYERSSKGEASQKPKHEGGFGKTKSKALKIYSDLKKVKQPLSPGGRLANFLNSLFTAGGNARKAKISSSSMGEPESTCSSASSFSRSCLSKTPSSSRGTLSNNNGGTKRSVRFYPVSVIVDEDCRPCGHKNLNEKEQTNYTTRTTRVEEIQHHHHHRQYQVMHESQRVQAAARELLKNYQNKKKKEEEFVCNVDNRASSDEDDDDEDGASCASSDLFELDNLSAIGIDRYREELPVYETTRLDTNRAIANGLIL